MNKTTKSEILSQLIKQKEPTVSELVDENHSLRAKNRIAYTGLVLLTAFSALVGWDAIKSRTNLNKAQQENKNLSEEVASFRKDATDLAFQNVDLKRYANDAQMLANSMVFYPSEPDSISSLDEKDQEKAEKKFLAANTKEQAEHEKALKTLGVDPKLLLRVQRGPHED